MKAFVKLSILLAIAPFGTLLAQLPLPIDIFEVKDLKRLQPESVQIPLVFTADEGDPNPAPEVFTSDVSYTDIKLKADRPWIEYSLKKIPKKPGVTLSVGVDASGLSAGTYTGTLKARRAIKKPFRKRLIRQVEFNITLNLQSPSPTFTDIDADLTGICWGSLAWGDYDNDGDLDLALMGAEELLPDAEVHSATRIYRNDGGSFHDINADLIDMSWGSLAWGDYDNDGDLDLAMAGCAGSYGEDPTSLVYRNDAGTFALSGIELEGVGWGSVAWGDADNDGDLDLAIAGFDDSHEVVSLIYANQSGTFTEVPEALAGVLGTSLAWGDYDNDGDLDLALAGAAGGGGRTGCICRNDQGTFTDIEAGLTGVGHYCSLAWGDYDNDGDLDLALAGETSVDGVYVTKVYRNDGGSFTDINAPLSGVKNCSVAWGDADNDGNLDLAAAGVGEPSPSDTSGTPMSTIYINDGNTFTPSGIELTGVSWSSIAWGDYDNDRNLDLAIAGMVEPETWITKIYRNNAIIPNTRPRAPQGLSSTVTGDEITFSWLPGSDAQTPDEGLYYNLRVGTYPGGEDVFPGMSDVSSGFRRLPAIGNAQQRLSWTLKGLTGENYFWDVQTVDAGFMGSAWQPPQPYSWARTYGGSEYDCAVSIDQTADDGYVVAGYTSYFGADTIIDSIDLVVLKLDPQGNVTWQKVYKDGGEFDIPYCIRQTTDEGYILVGCNTDTSTTSNFNSSSFWVLKLDTQGNVSWKKTFDDGCLRGPGGGMNILQTSDGGYVLGGYTFSFGYNADLWVLKLDPLGNIQWQKAYGGTDYELRQNIGIVQTQDDGYILTTCTSSFGEADGDFWVLKLNSSGDILWQKTYGGDIYDLPTDIQQTSDGGYIVSGWTASFFVGSWTYEFWIIKLDPSGNIVWQKVYTGGSSHEDCNVRQTPDGGFIVAGEHLLFSGRHWDIVVMKLDSSGSILWQKTYGGNARECVTGSSFLELTSDGGCVICGYTEYFELGNYDVLILKLDSSGEIADCDMGINSSLVTNNTSVTAQVSNGVVNNTDAFVTNSSVIPQEGSAQIQVICPETP